MKYQIRQSDDKSFYYLLEIDADNNEKFIADNKNLAELKKHDAIKGKKVDVVGEAEVRGTVPAPDDASSQE